MKIICDKDLHIDCPFIAQGETVEEVVAKSINHIKKEHPEEMEDMNEKWDDYEIIELVQSKIKEN